MFSTVEVTMHSKLVPRVFSCIEIPHKGAVSLALEMRLAVLLHFVIALARILVSKLRIDSVRLQSMKIVRKDLLKGRVFLTVHRLNGCQNNGVKDCVKSNWLASEIIFNQ